MIRAEAKPIPVLTRLMGAAHRIRKAVIDRLRWPDRLLKEADDAGVFKRYDLDERAGARR